MFNLFYGDEDYYSNLNKNTIEFSLDFTTVWFVILGFENLNLSLLYATSGGIKMGQHLNQ
jgi:hypothetical protein